VNIICSGIPIFSAIWTCAKDGGFAIIASAINGWSVGAASRLMPPSKPRMLSVLLLAGAPRPSPASIQDLQHPRTISSIPFRRLPTSPLFKESNPGMRPGFLTIKAMSSAGSPPMLKNSKPFSSTKPWNVGCVANRTRCPYVLFKTLPSATKGCTSPLDPTTCITTFSFGGGVCPGNPPSAGGIYPGGSGVSSSCATRESWFLNAGTRRSESLRVFWLMLILILPSSVTLALVSKPSWLSSI
jgi:hypothetical protein